MIFEKNYDDKDRSTKPRNIEISNKQVYRWNEDKKQYTEEVVPDEYKKYNVVLEVHGKNKLNSKSDVIKFNQIVKNVVYKTLKLAHFNFDFVKISQLCKKMAQESFSNKIKVDNNPKLLQCIDEASGGGCLIAKAGTYDGKYSMFDISNSYNKFFIEYNIPTEPKFKTVKSLKTDTVFTLFRLEMKDKKYLEKEYTMKFKTNRRWFTKWDVEIFDMFGIEYNLLAEDNNCIEFDTVDCDFDWMEAVNELKQNTDKEKNSIQYDVCKVLLSSFWGQCSRYATVEFPEGVKPNLPREWFYKSGDMSGDKIYINPNQIYKYSVGIIKPFVLAFGRYRLLKQVKKLEKKGYDTIYAQTDSILTEKKAKKYFDLGSNIGQWKLDKTSENGVEVKNIASKTFY